MPQSVATLASLIIAGAMMAVIIGVIADDWVNVVRALALGREIGPLDIAAAPAGRRARVVRVSPQSVPLRAAA